jgi:DNA anti-recombination protein RmuC
MNEIRTVEDVHRFLAEYDRAHPHWRAEAEEDKKRAVERRKREAEAEQQARNAREAEKQQAASNDWYAAVDTRVRAHFKDWAWAAIDERIDALTQRWWEHEWDVLKDAIGGALGKKAAQVRDELKRAIEEQQRVFEAKLTEQKERLNNSADEAQGRLREEFRRALEETVASAGAEIAALEQRLKAMPGRLPVVKT